MSKQFWIECDKCQHDVEFDIGDVEDLTDHIEREVEGAADEAEKQFEGMVDPDDMSWDARLFHDLSAAITRADTSECRRLFDRIAEEIGGDVQLKAELGRFAKVLA